MVHIHIPVSGKTTKKCVAVKLCNFILILLEDLHIRRQPFRVIGNIFLFGFLTVFLEVNRFIM